VGDAVELLARLAVPIAIVALLLFLGLRRQRAAATPVADGPEDEIYKAYTREFDLVVPANQVLDMLDTASPDGAKGWLYRDTSDWRPLQVESLLARSRAALAAGREELIAALRGAAAGADPSDIVVTMLVDQSGSMKDDRIISVAVATTLIAELVHDLGARSEVLGFSTAGWRGGHARLKWLQEGRPERPGRLAALMHIVYKSAEDPSLDEEARRVMVHPDLLRENIDGEAIEWARARLAALPGQRKILIVISDGAPVDDSTLLQNELRYLYRHLTKVLAEIEEAGDLTIGGLGINHRVDAFYPLSETVDALEDLPEAGYRLLGKLIAASEPGVQPREKA
jgi:cobaltochelatase CobT